MKYGSYMPLVSWDFSYEWIHSFCFSDWWRCEGANTRFMKPTHCVRILLGVLSVQFYLMAVALWGTCCPHIIDDEVETQSESYCISKPAPSLESKHPLLLPNLCIFPFLPPGRCQCEGQTVLCCAATSQLFFLMPVACLLWHLILQVIQEKSPMNLFSTYLSPSSLACEARQKSLRVQWACVCSSLVPYSFQHPSDYLFLGMVTKRHMLPSA